MAPNKNTLKNNVSIRIFTAMLLYGLLINFVLLMTVISSKDWLIVIGFNFGLLGSLIGFVIIALSGKWLTSGAPAKQAFAFMSFFLRMLIYGTILVTTIIWNLANIPSVIGGFSILLFATITSELVLLSAKKIERKRN